MNTVIEVIVSCSNRKKLRVVPGLSLREVRSRDHAERVRLWVANLKYVPVQTCKAEHVYAGDHWATVRSLASQRLTSALKVRVWICSAGYGLIPFHANIKAYQATFSRGHMDSVAQSTNSRDVASENLRWWNSLACEWSGPCPDEPRRFWDIRVKYGRNPMLVVLSSDYLNAVRNDLLQLVNDPYYQSNLSIISCGHRSANELFSQNVLPCDVQMQSAVGGVRVSLNIRIAARLLETLGQSFPSYRTFERLCGSIQRQPGAHAYRVKMSDSEIEDFIRFEIRKDAGSTHTSLLRLLRQRKLSCEQSRFARIFKDVVVSMARNNYA